MTPRPNTPGTFSTGEVRITGTQQAMQIKYGVGRDSSSRNNLAVVAAFTADFLTGSAS